MTPEELAQQAQAYALKTGLKLDLDQRLGFGQDGCVWSTPRKTALKVFERLHNYTLERNCYQRLKNSGVTSICGVHVPSLVDFDDTLMVVEIEIVRPPYLLDFGKVHLDTPPPYSPDQLEDWEELLVERFGEDVSLVKTILWKLQSLGIYYLDAKPDNIRLHADDHRYWDEV